MIRKKDIVVSLYDYTGEMVRPWAEAGYTCFILDIQHPIGTNPEQPIGDRGGAIVPVHADLHNNMFLVKQSFEVLKDRIALVTGFPVCTDLAVSGARHFEAKAKVDPDFQTKAAGYAIDVSEFGEHLGVPWMVENPVGRLSTLWRKADFWFHPFEYGGYIPESEADHPRWPEYIAPRDAYSKKTGIWCGGGFRKPLTKPVECENFGSSRQHRKLGGKSMKTKNVRSATPRGFALAVFEEMNNER